MDGRFSIFAPHTGTLLGVINAALTGKGSIVIRASKRGVTVSLNGRALATGKTADELHDKLSASIKAACAATKNQ